ncbi:hypothetical protein [Amycolatopsis eburnea]|uniref:hypothetical protein n=1 Tax=Amycolatopsis eburnea TaxID=2267691 RepID=UPI001CDB8AE0|nr:hypothetical protein [Amycolatopsis eburnea]
MLAKILKPVRAAAAGSPSALDLHDSLPGFAGDGVCGVAVALFDEPWTSAFFDDGTRFGVAGDGLRRSGPSSGSVAELLGLAFARLPLRSPAPGSGLYLDADERGVLAAGQECLVLDLMEELRRPRLGTVQIDLARGPRRPWEVVAFVDDARGRHLAVLGRRRGGRRRFWWLPGSVDGLAEIVEGRIPEHV